MSGQTRARSIMLALLVICSSIGAVAIPAIAQQSPAGLTSVPSSNVQDQIPNGSSINARAANFRGSVMSGSHPETTEITLVPAANVLGPSGERMGSAGELAIQISDDTNHEGRDVALPLEAVRRNVGQIPQRVYGVHSSGERWSAPVRREGSLIVFHVPQFSTNTVTFSGSVEISGDPALSETQYSYDVRSLDSVGDYRINVTGSRATETDTESGVVSDGGTLPISIAGNADPIGTEVTLTGVETTGSWSANGTDATGGSTSAITVDGNVAPENATITFKGNRTTASGSASGTGATNSTTSTISVGGNEPPEDVSVTFDGRETLQSASASGADRYDGDTASVSVAGDGSPKNVDVTFKGDTVSSSRVSSGSASDGATKSISVGGNLDPGGPASGEPEVSVTSWSRWYSQNEDLNVSGGDEQVYQSTAKTTYSVEFSGSTSTTNAYGAYDVYVADGATDDGNYGDGTKCGSVKLEYNGMDKTVTCDLATQSTVTLELVQTDSHSADSLDANAKISGGKPSSIDVSADTGQSTSVPVTGSSGMDMDTSTSSLSFTVPEQATVDYEVNWNDRTATEDPAVDVDGDGSNDASYTGIITSGSSQTVSVDAGDLSAGSSTLTFSTASGSRTDWTLDYDEAHWTTDPSVDLNSDGDADASYTGVIGPSSSQTVSADAELVDGDHTADWSVDGPAPTDWSVSWTEVTTVKDPGVDVDGDGYDDASYLGTLDTGESVTESVTNLSSGSVSMAHSGSGASYNWSMSATSVYHTEDPAVDVDGDGVNDMSVSGILAPGDSVTESVDMTRSTTELAVSANGGSDVDAAATYTEVTETRDPTVEVNGHTTSYVGTLSDGSTESLSTNESWIVNGTNRVNVTVSDGVSADAPPGEIGLDYRHNALDQQTVDYQGEKWSERYNVSKTWADDRTNATLSVTMSDTVVEVRDLQRSINGSGYQAADPANYSLDNGTLTYQMGNVSSSTEVDIRLNASKVSVGNGEIDVVDPTAPGDALNSKIEVVSKSAGFYIDVSGSADGNYLHYAANESWTSPDVYTEHEADGSQYLYAPNSSAGSTMRVKTTAVEVLPDTGDVHVKVVNESATKLKVSEGSTAGDTVAWRYHDTESGEEYELWSVSDSVVRDTDTAESPVLLSDDDSSETLWIRLATSDTSSSGGYSGAGGGGGSGPVSSDTGLLNSVPVVIGFGALAIGAVALLLRRYTSDRILQLGGTAVTAIVVLVGIGEAWAPGIVLGPIGESLGQVAPVIALVAVVWSAYYGYIRFIRGYTTIVEVAGERIRK